MKASQPAQAANEKKSLGRSKADTFFADDKCLGEGKQHEREDVSDMGAGGNACFYKTIVQTFPPTPIVLEAPVTSP
jgi:hypothetical protein